MLRIAISPRYVDRMLTKWVTELDPSDTGYRSVWIDHIAGPQDDIDAWVLAAERNDITVPMDLRDSNNAIKDIKRLFNQSTGKLKDGSKFGEYGDFVYDEDDNGAFGLIFETPAVEDLLQNKKEAGMKTKYIQVDGVLYCNKEAAGPLWQVWYREEDGYVDTYGIHASPEDKAMEYMEREAQEWADKFPGSKVSVGQGKVSVLLDLGEDDYGTPQRGRFVYGVGIPKHPHHRQPIVLHDPDGGTKGQIDVNLAFGSWKRVPERFDLDEAKEQQAQALQGLKAPKKQVPINVTWKPSRTGATGPELGPEYDIPVSVYDDAPNGGFDPEVILWYHGGQNDPVYALGSRLNADAETLASQEELDALKAVIEPVLFIPEGVDPETVEDDPDMSDDEYNRTHALWEAIQAVEAGQTERAHEGRAPAMQLTQQVGRQPQRKPSRGPKPDSAVVKFFKKVLNFPAQARTARERSCGCGARGRAAEKKLSLPGACVAEIMGVSFGEGDVLFEERGGEWFVNGVNSRGLVDDTLLSGIQSYCESMTTASCGRGHDSEVVQRVPKGPGKFSDNVDEKVYNDSVEGWNVEELGEAEYFGHYSLIDYSSDPLIVVDHGARETYNGAIVAIDNQGVVQVAYFATFAEAQEKWRELEREYEAYLEEVERENPGMNDMY